MEEISYVKWIKRIKKKYQVEDFKKVIDIKIEDWLDNSKMNKFLIPNTLFGPKFEGYLNERSLEESKKIYGW